MALKTRSPKTADISLSDLADFIWGNEIFFGQASKIGNDGKLTVVVFDNSIHAPKAVDNTTRVKVVAGTSNAPAGAQAFLCQGKAFVGGAEAYVKVYRV